MRVHFEEVRTRRQFLQISLCFMRSLVSDPSVAKRSEQSVFESVVAWLGAQQPAPSGEEARTLLQLVRYCEMPIEYVRTVVLRHPTVLAHPDRHGLLLESFLNAAAASSS